MRGGDNTGRRAVMERLQCAGVRILTRLPFMYIMYLTVNIIISDLCRTFRKVG